MHGGRKHQWLSMQFYSSRVPIMAVYRMFSLSLNSEAHEGGNLQSVVQPLRSE